MTQSRIRIAAVAGIAAAVAIAAVLLFTGGADGGTGKLSWAGHPQVFKSGKPTDRVFTARIENTSLREVELDVDDVRILDDDQHEVQGTARFLASFVHGLWSWSQKPSRLTDFERRRLGQIVTLKPGDTAPIALSWRVPAGSQPPTHVDFGVTSVRLP